jgi:hypothetical protein
VIEISKITLAVIEKQEIILNKLTDLSYNESIKLMASLSSLLTNIDWLQVEGESQCNRLLFQTMKDDPRTTVSKAESMMKSSDVYRSYKKILSLKQCTSRGLGIVRFHLHYLLKSKVETDSEVEEI